MLSDRESEFRPAGESTRNILLFNLPSNFKTKLSAVVSRFPAVCLGFWLIVKRGRDHGFLYDWYRCEFCHVWFNYGETYCQHTCILSTLGSTTVIRREEIQYGCTVRLTSHDIPMVLHRLPESSDPVARFWWLKHHRIDNTSYFLTLSLLSRNFNMSLIIWWG